MPATGRLLRATAGVGVLAVTFVAGVTLGAAGREAAPATAPSIPGPRDAVAADAATLGTAAVAAAPTAGAAVEQGVIDEAAARLADEADREIGRGELERAAIEGMLRALDDPWASYSTPPATVPPAKGSTGFGEFRGPGLASPVTMDMLPSGVPRVRVTSFSRGVGRQVREALAQLPAPSSRGVVLDLRGDPGGLLDEAVETASAFLDGGPVVSFSRRGSPPQVFNAVGDGDTVIPLVVLVDGATASAAEVVAGALQDRGRAVVVGSRTFGKGSVQEPLRLSDGSAVEVTVARYRTPAGRSLDGAGLEPDIEVAPGSLPAVAEWRAADVLRGVSADAGSGAG